MMSYLSLQSILNSWCLSLADRKKMKKTCNDTCTAARLYISIGHCSSRNSSSLTEMEAPRPRKTHSTPFNERSCTEGRFPIDALLDVKMVQASNPPDQTKKRISKPRFLCKISWSKMDLLLKNGGNTNKLTSSFSKSCNQLTHTEWKESSRHETSLPSGKNYW